HFSDWVRSVWFFLNDVDYRCVTFLVAVAGWGTFIWVATVGDIAFYSAISRGAACESAAGRNSICRRLFTRRVICGLWIWGFGNRVPQNFVPVTAFGFGLFVGGHAVAGGDFGIQDAESDLAFLNNTEATPCLLFNVGIAFVLIDLGEQA